MSDLHHSPDDNPSYGARPPGVLLVQVRTGGGRHLETCTMTIEESLGTIDEVPRLKDLFVSTAVEYYVSGRFACLEGLLNVGGNLCHHAVEMMLKAHLVVKHELQELSNHPFGHDLPHLWQTFKAEVVADLDRYDETINELHKFDEIRYPDTTSQRGSVITVGLTRSSGRATDGEGKPRPEPRYDLGLKEIDDLVAAIFEAASINVRAYLPGAFPSGVRHYLYEHNKAMREGDK